MSQLLQVTNGHFLNKLSSPGASWPKGTCVGSQGFNRNLFVEVFGKIHRVLVTLFITHSGALYVTDCWGYNLSHFPPSIRLTCSSSNLLNCYVAKDSFELLIFLPPPPLECWDYRCTPSHLVYVLLCIEFMYYIGHANTLSTELYPQPWGYSLKISPISPKVYHICMYIHIFVYIHICVCIPSLTYNHMCIYPLLCADICLYVHPCLCVFAFMLCKYMCVYTCLCVFVCASMCIHLCVRQCCVYLFMCVHVSLLPVCVVASHSMSVNTHKHRLKSLYRNRDMWQRGLGCFIGWKR